MPSLDNLLVEPGLTWADFAGIEARVVAWFAGQEDKLDVFRAYDRGDGPDAYCVAASGIYGRIISKKDEVERSVGKVSELALGYQGGISAYYTMCAPYNLSLAPVVPVIFETATSEEKELAFKSYVTYRKQKEKEEKDYFNEAEGMTADIIKQRWRIKNPKIVQFWADIDAAAKRVMLGDWTPFDRINWSTHKWDNLTGNPGDSDRQYGPRFLYLGLPSKRKLAYFKPKLERITTKWGSEKLSLTCCTIDSKTKQLVRRAMYGGLWTENIVQAASRDIMVAAAQRVRVGGHKVNLTVHDELLLPNPGLEIDEKEIQRIMTQPISWAPGLPLAVGIKSALRYGK